MSYLVNYKNWKRLYEATFAFDPSGNYPDETFGLPTGGVDSGKVSPGGAGGDWDGSMQRALAFGKIANEFVGKNIISSQKRTQVKTASNRTSDHFDGQDFTYAVDLGCNLETGDRLLAHLMDWFGHPEYKGGTWFNVVKDGYRYQVGWRVPNHFNHIHVGVKKQDGKDSVSGVTTPAATELTTNNQNINMAQIQSGAKLLKLGMQGEDVRAIQVKLKELGYFTKEPTVNYDNDTYAAVKAFQTTSKIKSDGIVGPITYGALFGVQISPEVIAKASPTQVNQVNQVDVILMGGLDYRPGDLKIDKQVELLNSGASITKKIIGHRYTELTKVLDSIAKNPNAKVVLFSAGGTYSKQVANAMQNKSNLYIVEPYAASANTKNSVQSAVTAGVPSKNVLTGSSVGRGKDVITGATMTPSNKGHWDALQYVGSLI